MELRPGMQLGHYRLVDRIGEGGMGVVWRAQDPKLGRDVAVKVLPQALAADPERLARLEQELYHVDVDRAESKDLAKENPEKLQALIKAWFDEADKNHVPSAPGTRPRRSSTAAGSSASA